MTTAVETVEVEVRQLIRRSAGPARTPTRWPSRRARPFRPTTSAACTAACRRLGDAHGRGEVGARRRRRLRPAPHTPRPERRGDSDQRTQPGLRRPARVAEPPARCSPPTGARPRRLRMLKTSGRRAGPVLALRSTRCCPTAAGCTWLSTSPGAWGGQHPQVCRVGEPPRRPRADGHPDPAGVDLPAGRGGPLGSTAASPAAPRRARRPSSTAFASAIRVASGGDLRGGLRVSCRCATSRRCSAASAASRAPARYR